MDAYMVEQVIKYSDGSETTIKYNPLGEVVSEPVDEEAEAPVIEEEAAKAEEISVEDESEPIEGSAE